MKQLKLVLPTSADEQEVWGYRKEFLEQGSSLDGSGGLAEAESFAQWYSKTLANRSEQTVCPLGWFRQPPFWRSMRMAS